MGSLVVLVGDALWHDQLMLAIVTKADNTGVMVYWLRTGRTWNCSPHEANMFKIMEE